MKRIPTVIIITGQIGTGKSLFALKYVTEVLQNKKLVIVFDKFLEKFKGKNKVFILDSVAYSLELDRHFGRLWEDIIKKAMKRRCKLLFITSNLACLPKIVKEKARLLFETRRSEKQYFVRAWRKTKSGRLFPLQIIKLKLPPKRLRDRYDRMRLNYVKELDKQMRKRLKIRYNRNYFRKFQRRI